MKSITGSAFCRALARRGWQHVRTNGSHQIWTKEGRGRVTVPVHAGKDLKPGLLAALLKQTGLNEGDL